MNGNVLEYLEGVITPSLLKHLAHHNSSIITLGGKRLFVFRTGRQSYIGQHKIDPDKFNSESVEYTSGGSLRDDIVKLPHNGVIGGVKKMHTLAKMKHNKR